MFQYKFLALCVLACLALGCSAVKAEASGTSNAELLRDVDVDIRKIDIELYDGIIDDIIEYLKDFFAQATTNCLKEVAKNCKKIWYNPKKLLKCAKVYFKEHEGECAILDTLEYETMLMSIYYEDDVEDVDLDISNIDIERYDEIINAIIDYLKGFYQKASIESLKEAVKSCKKIWYKPKELLQCVTEQFKNPQGDYAKHDAMEYENLPMTIDNDTELVELIDGPIETRLSLKKIIRALLRLFSKVVRKCIRTAVKNCKSHWPNVPALIQCARQYVKEHHGRCIRG